MKQKSFFEKVFGFLLSGTNQSSMRLGFILAILGGLYIMICVGRYIMSFAGKGTEITQWEGMGVFLLGIATIMTGIAWMKERQKKTEINAAPDGKEQS